MALRHPRPPKLWWIQSRVRIGVVTRARHLTVLPSVARHWPAQWRPLTFRQVQASHTLPRKEALNQSDIERRCVVRQNKQLQAAQSAIASARAPPPHSPSCSEILALLRSGAFWNNLDGIKSVGSMEQFSYLLFYQRNNRRSQRKKGIKKKPVSCASSAVPTSCFLLGFFFSFFYDKQAPSESPLMRGLPNIWKEILQLLTAHYCHPGENTRCTPPRVTTTSPLGAPGAAAPGVLCSAFRK